MGVFLGARFRDGNCDAFRPAILDAIQRLGLADFWYRYRNSPRIADPAIGKSRALGVALRRGDGTVGDAITWNFGEFLVVARGLNREFL